MKSPIRLFTGFAFAILIFSACSSGKKTSMTSTDKPMMDKSMPGQSMADKLREAEGLLATAAQQRNVSQEDFMQTLVYKA